MLKKVMLILVLFSLLSCIMPKDTENWTGNNWGINKKTPVNNKIQKEEEKLSESEKKIFELSKNSSKKPEIN